MRKTSLALLATLTGLLGALAVTPTAGAAPSRSDGPLLDARAAAAAAGTDGVGTQATWFTGTLSPGSTQYWTWNNASSTSSYAVGLAPTGASTTANCVFEVTREYYAQRYGGELEFRFNVKNVGTISCGANVLLTSTSNSSITSTGGLNPGSSKSYTWNNNVAGQAHLVALVPSGATSTADCLFEVTRGYYYRQSTGEREFRYTVKNVGTIACQASVRMAFIASSSSWSTSTLSPGSTSHNWWNNAPSTRVYVPGLQPSATNCAVEVTRTYYQQRLNSGVPEREFHLDVKNVGGVSCYATILLSGLTAS